MYTRGLGDLAPSLTFSKVGGGPAALFYSGEAWVIDITGPALEPVWLVANGRAPAQLGSTDAGGRFHLQGTVGDGEIGHWGELWYVGRDQPSGAFAGSVSFEVQAKSKSGGPAAPPAGNDAAALAQQTPDPGLPARLAFQTIPAYAWIGAGLAALFFFGGSRR